MPNSPKRNNRRNSKERRDSKKRQQQRGNMKGGSSATGIDNHMKEILGEYKLAVPQPSQSENAFGSRYDVGKLALTGGSRKDYKNRQRGGVVIDDRNVLTLFIENNINRGLLNNGQDADNLLNEPFTNTNILGDADNIQDKLDSLDFIRNAQNADGTAKYDIIVNRPFFKAAYIRAKLSLVGDKSDARRQIIDGINNIQSMNATPILITDSGNDAATKITNLINNANAPALNALNTIYTTATGVVTTGGKRKSQSKQSPKRSGKSPKKQSQKKNTKSPKKQQRGNNMRGGNYYLNVDAQKIGGLTEVTRVDQPLAPEASTFNKYPEPLYLKDLSNPTTVNGMANSVNVANAPTTGQTAGAKKEYMFVTNKRTGQPMKVRKSPKQMQMNMNNKNVQVRVFKQQGGVEGEQSVYTGDMMQRDFSGKQPDWSPKVI